MARLRSSRVALLIPAVGLATACATTPAQRLETCRTEHPTWHADGVCTDLAHGYVEAGMTAEQVRFARGRPLSVEVIEDEDGVGERWTYYAGPVSADDDLYLVVYLENGIVVRVVD